MAKKKQIIEANSKAVTNCNQLFEPVANRDQFVVNEPTFSQSDIEKMIPNNFRFQLTEAERDEVVTNCDNLRSLKFNPTLPYAFTESGIAQLSSVLHSKKAIETSVKIMSAFVSMRHFLIQNAGVLMRIAHLEHHQIETDEKIDLILDKMEERSPKLLPKQIFQTGCVCFR